MPLCVCVGGGGQIYEISDRGVICQPSQIVTGGRGSQKLAKKVSHILCNPNNGQQL
jgi:hypothetical protein